MFPAGGQPVSCLPSPLPFQNSTDGGGLPPVAPKFGQNCRPPKGQPYVYPVMGNAKLWAAAILPFVPLWAQDQPAYTFGTTVVDSSGLQGRVYQLKPNTQRLPKFGRLKPVATVYTTSLNVWPQS